MARRVSLYGDPLEDVMRAAAPARKAAPPRPSRIEQQVAEYGLVYNREAIGVKGSKGYIPARSARGPGPNAPVFARRQLDKLRDLPPPFAVRADATEAAVFVRSHQGEHFEVGEVLGDRRLLTAITVLRLDAANPAAKRTEEEAKRFAWALRRLHGKRSIPWTRYLTRK